MQMLQKDHVVVVTLVVVLTANLDVVNGIIKVAQGVAVKAAILAVYFVVGVMVEHGAVQNQIILAVFVFHVAEYVHVTDVILVDVVIYVFVALTGLLGVVVAECYYISIELKYKGFFNLK